MNDHNDIDAAILELRGRDQAPADEVLAARRMLNAAIAAEQRKGRPPQRRWALAAGWVAAALVAAVAAGAVTSLRAPSATALMFDLVGIVTREAPLAQAEGEFVYVRSEGEAVVTSGVTIADAAQEEIAWQESFVDERWFAADGSFRLRRVAGEPEFFTDVEEQIFRADPALRDRQAEVFQIDSEPVPQVVDRTELPLETAALRAALIAGYELVEGETSRPLEVELAEIAAELTVLHDTSPELRGALLALLAETEGLEVVGSDLGTVTVGVEFDTVNSRDRIELAFDAATGRLIERRTVYVVPPEGTSIPPGPASILRYDAPRVVDELGP